MSNVANGNKTGGAMSSVPTEVEEGIRLPSPNTMLYCAKLGITEDKPIMMDYWVDSIKKRVFIGVRDDGSKEKILVRSAEEYTSPIGKMYKNEEDHIVITENSIYIIAAGIPIKKFSV